MLHPVGSVSKPDFSRIIVLAVGILAAISYFHRIPENPPGFYIDEASIAYNQER